MRERQTERDRERRERGGERERERKNDRQTEKLENLRHKLSDVLKMRKTKRKNKSADVEKKIY